MFAMLDRLVRPLVRTQIQILAQTRSASARLMSMISQWLGYLGVQADVTQLRTTEGKIQISVAVSKPEQCSDQEWNNILHNINQTCAITPDTGLAYTQLPPPQRTKVAHLLALVIHAGNPEIEQDWDQLQPRLTTFNLEPALLTDIQVALRQTLTFDHLLENLEPEVAAFVLSRAIGIALLDQQINQHEDTLLKALYNVIEINGA
jgi:hypothetical protein